MLKNLPIEQNIFSFTIRGGRIFSKSLQDGGGNKFKSEEKIDNLVIDPPIREGRGKSRLSR